MADWSKGSLCKKLLQIWISCLDKPSPMRTIDDMAEQDSAEYSQNTLFRPRPRKAKPDRRRRPLVVQQFDVILLLELREQVVATPGARCRGQQGRVAVVGCIGFGSGDTRAAGILAALYGSL